MTIVIYKFQTELNLKAAIEPLQGKKETSRRILCLMSNLTTKKKAIGGGRSDSEKEEVRIGGGKEKGGWGG